MQTSAMPSSGPRFALLCSVMLCPLLAGASIDVTRVREEGLTMSAFGKLAASSPANFSNSSYPLPAPGALVTRYGPLPPAACEVLLLVAFSSVNPSDVNPTMATTDAYPKAMGSDVAGRVFATHGKCVRLEAGDFVWGDIGANTHVLAAPGKVGAKTKELGAYAQVGAKTKELGAYAQFAVALESQLALSPKGMGMQEAGTLPKVALTSLKAFRWYTALPQRVGLSVVVLGGSSGTGLVALQLARHWGAAQVITTTSLANFGLVRALGATSSIDYHSTHWWEAIGNRSVDVVYDCVGEAGTGDRAVAKLRAGGAYVTITGTLADGPLPPNTTQHMFINSDTNLNSSTLLDELTALAERGALRMPVVDSTFALVDVHGGFARSQSHHAVGKISVAVPHPTKAQVAAATAMWGGEQRVPPLP